MANTIRDYSATAASNTVVDGADISEGCSPAGINDAIRGVMADLKDVSTGAVALESPAMDSLTVDTTGIVYSGGNVGIGTTSPSQEIHGYSSGGDFSLKLESASATGTAYTYYKNADREYATGIRGSASDSFQIIDITADATRLAIDSSGRVTMPYQPGFSVRQLAQSNIDCSSSDYIPFRHIHTTNFNTGNHFSSSTGRFTAPVAGNYIFGTTIRYDAFSGSYFYVTLLKNGSTFGARELTSLTGNYLHASVHTIMNMAAGDYVYVTLRNTGDSNIHIDHDCNFYGYLLG